MAAQKPANQSGIPSFPLFYQNPVPLDREKHEKLSLNPEMSFAFAKEAAAVPINAVEFPFVCAHYPIAFSAGDTPTPLAVVGLKNKNNLFVNVKGEWGPNTYIPAYVRRYPFILAQDEKGERMALCIDDAKGILAKNHKNPFFEKGKNTVLTENALEFCRSYQRAAVDTEKFMLALKNSGILTDRQAEIRTPDGEVSHLSGFLAVDEQKFRELPDKVIIEWHKNGYLRLIDAHILSNTNWQKLFNLLPKSVKKKK